MGCFSGHTNCCIDFFPFIHLKFLFFPVTKYIKVGLDDPNQSNNNSLVIINGNDTIDNNNRTLLNNLSSSLSTNDQTLFHYDDGKYFFFLKIQFCLVFFSLFVCDKVY